MLAAGPSYAGMVGGPQPMVVVHNQGVHVIKYQKFLIAKMLLITLGFPGNQSVSGLGYKDGIGLYKKIRQPRVNRSLVGTPEGVGRAATA